jgi:hypothetical protein
MFYMLTSFMIRSWAPDGGHDVRRIHHLNFGDLVRLIERPQIWDRLNLPYIHHQTITQSLGKINRIRNDVMHFNPDP